MLTLLSPFTPRHTAIFEPHYKSAPQQLATVTRQRRMRGPGNGPQVPTMSAGDRPYAPSEKATHKYQIERAASIAARKVINAKNESDIHLTLSHVSRRSPIHEIIRAEISGHVNPRTRQPERAWFAAHSAHLDPLCFRKLIALGELRGIVNEAHSGIDAAGTVREARLVVDHIRAWSLTPANPGLTIAVRLAEHVIGNVAKTDPQQARKLLQYLKSQIRGFHKATEHSHNYALHYRRLMWVCETIRTDPHHVTCEDRFGGP